MSNDLESVQFGGPTPVPPLNGEDLDITISPPSSQDDQEDQDVDDDTQGAIVTFAGSSDDDIFGDDSREDLEEDEEDDGPDDDLEGDADFDDDDDSEDDDSDFNATVFMAKNLKETGALSDDFEITPDITFEEVASNFRQKARGDATAEGRLEGKNEILQKYPEETLLYVDALRNGADPTQFSTTERMRVYGQVDLTSASEEDKETLVKSMFLLKGMNDSDAQDLLEVKKKKGELDVLAAQSKEAHAGGYQKWRTQVEQADAEKDRIRAQKESAAIAKVHNIITTRKVGGIEFDKEQAADLYRDLFEARETLVHEGKSYPVTAVNKFLHEFQNDVELQLELYMLRKDKGLLLNKVKEDAKSSAEEEMRKAAQKVRKRKKTKSNSRQGNIGTHMDGVVYSS